MLTLPHLFWQLGRIVCDAAAIITKQATSTTFVLSRAEAIAASNSSSRTLRLSNS